MKCYSINIIGYETVPASQINPNEDYVVLTVSGDSMYPEFQDGDHVLVRVQSSVDSGDYGIVFIDGDSAVIKKITYGDDWIELVSVNPMYPPRRFENEDVLNIRGFGLVKKSWRCYLMSPLSDYFLTLLNLLFSAIYSFSVCFFFIINDNNI